MGCLASFSTGDFVVISWGSRQVPIMYQNVTYPENEEDSRAALEQMRPEALILQKNLNDWNQCDLEMSDWNRFQKT